MEALERRQRGHTTSVFSWMMVDLSPSAEIERSRAIDDFIDQYNGRAMRDQDAITDFACC